MTAITTREKVFSFDQVEEIVEQLFDEAAEEKNARVTYENEYLTLTVCRIKDCEVQVFRIKENPELYAQMDAKYLDILENESSGSDFWDMWNTIINVLESHRIVDEVFNP